MIKSMNPVNQAQPLPQPRGMRTWRVGSLSMGITLMLIGTALAVSIWQDAEAYEMLLWVAPIVFILLGAELLIHLKLSGSQHTIVKYDWISVFFVGVIGTASLVLALLMSSGLFDELNRGLHMTQRSAFVDTVKETVPEHISKIMVSSLGNVEIKTAPEREVQLFGQIRYWSAEPLAKLNESMMRTNTAGDTMYIMIGTVERRDGGFVTDTVHPQLTLIVPEGIEIEERR